MYMNEQLLDFDGSLAGAAERALLNSKREGVSEGVADPVDWEKVQGMIILLANHLHENERITTLFYESAQILEEGFLKLAEGDPRREVLVERWAHTKSILDALTANNASTKSLVEELLRIPFGMVIHQAPSRMQ